eukprot:1894305-Rhodomonas_salina.1
MTRKQFLAVDKNHPAKTLLPASGGKGAGVTPKVSSTKGSKKKRGSQSSSNSSSRAVSPKPTKSADHMDTGGSKDSSHSKNGGGGSKMQLDETPTKDLFSVFATALENSAKSQERMQTQQFEMQKEQREFLREMTASTRDSQKAILSLITGVKPLKQICEDKESELDKSLDSDKFTLLSDDDEESLPPM